MPNDRIPFRKGRLAANPVGWHVKMPYLGRDLLGTVTEAHYNDVLGAWFLTVNHFNGRPWPLKPTALSVRILERNHA